MPRQWRFPVRVLLQPPRATPFFQLRTQAAVEQICRLDPVTPQQLRQLALPLREGRMSSAALRTWVPGSGASRGSATAARQKR